MKYTKFTIIIATLFSFLPLWAEPSDGQSKRVCQILCLNKPVDFHNQGFLFDGTESHEVTLSTKGFSNVVALPKGELNLHISPRQVDKSQDLPEGAVSVKISKEINDFYILIKATANGEESKYSLEVVDASDGKLKPGETLWINFTKHNISAEIGENSFPIPSEGRVVSTPPLKENGYYPVYFKYQREGKGDYHPVFKRTWRHMKTAKSLGFVIDKDLRGPEIFTVRDRR